MRKTLLGVVLVVVLTGCGGTEQQAADRPTPSATSTPSGAAPISPSASPTPTPTPSAKPASGTVPPAWLGTRVLPRASNGYGEIRRTPKALRNRRFTLPDTLPSLPGTGFASEVTAVPADVLARSTWQPACPVPASDLRWVRLTFRGFDEARHTGELLVNKSAARPLVSVFRRLWRLRFPIEEMRITRRDEQTAPPTGDGNNTGAFDCRPTVGASFYSQHAYGLAVDLDPFQNPYVKGDLVLPERASAYLDRSQRRPGMIEPGDDVVRAFAAIGWGWGGDFTRLKDLQHFSANGR